MSEMISPSLPTTTLDTRSSGPSWSSGSGTVSTVTSTVTSDSSDARRSGNLGSWHASRAASTMAFPRGITGIGNPMHPRRSPDGKRESVTNAPALSPKPSGTAGGSEPVASASTALLARTTASRPLTPSIP